MSAMNQNTPLYAAVNDVATEIGAIKKNPMAGSIPFVGLDAALERMRQVAIDVANQDTEQTAANAGQVKDTGGQSGSTVKS